MKCDIIKDLIPLSGEGLCSEESEREIAEHIKTCESCRLLYEKSPETVTEILNIPDEKESFKKVNRKFKKLTIKSGIIALLLIAVLAVLGWLTYNQITKGGGMVSFETIFQSFEVRKIANYIAEGDFESYVDTISKGSQEGIRYANAVDIKQKDIQLLQQTFETAYGDTEVKKVRVVSFYDAGATQLYYSDSAYSVFTVVEIIFENEKNFVISFRKNIDGKYIAYIVFNSKTDEESGFLNALIYANYHDVSPHNIVESLMMKTNVSAGNPSHAMYSNRFHEQYREQVKSGRCAFYESGFTMKTAYFSSRRYDEEKDMLYYDLTIEAEDSKGTAVMTSKIYYDYMGLIPPERNDIKVYSENCTSELENALYNFFG